MKFGYKIGCLLFLFLVPIMGVSQSQVSEDSMAYHDKMTWFREAKLGIFIHWGIYAVNGISESWSFYNGYISHEDYVKQVDGFSAKNYDPKYWVELIKSSGAKYSVITTRHHDGFALWDTKYGTFNALKTSPAKRDLIAPFVEELRDNDIKVGLYFSLPDWSHENYTDHTSKIKRYAVGDDPARWEKFQQYNFGQLSELKKKFDPDLWWFDGDWEHSAEEWDVMRLKSMLTDKKPGVIFNSRLQGGGDYATPEIGAPVYQPKDQYWELCMTMNDSWGYQQNDKNYKTSTQIIDIFVDCVSKGGNLLLDIGPMADGTIPPEQENILRELGAWTQKHAAAVYGTNQGVPFEHFSGPSGMSRDSSILYLYVRDIPKDGKVTLKGIKNKINRIYVVGNGTILDFKIFNKPYWSAYPGIFYIDLPENVLDKYYTVLAVVLDGPVRLYKDN